jgi:NADH-quinone oxidoreductase subunit M
VTNEKNAHLPDLQPREWLVIVPVLAMTIVMGVAPNLFLRPMGPSIERLLSQFHQGAASRLQATAKPSALSPQPSALRERPEARR